MVEVFGRPTCQPCKRTKLILDNAGVSYVYHDIEEDPAAAEELRSMGFQQVPVVRSPAGIFSGLQPDRLKSLIAERLAA
jgi:glutaredoxin-like protein NrdH